MIEYHKHDCMCWEKDEFDQPLECDPTDCFIDFCPIKQLLSKLEAIKEWVDRYRGTYSVEYEYPWDEMEKIMEGE